MSKSHNPVSTFLRHPNTHPTNSSNLTLCLVLLSWLLSWATPQVEAQVEAKQQSKPNIVLFFVDDLGWKDLGYRNATFESPNIDRLAGSCTDFELATIACPTCSPSRATLLTGKHPARLQLVRHIPTGAKKYFDKFGRTETRYNLLSTDPAQFPCVNWLSLEHTTYAEALKELGYYNAFIGKWHLGHEPFHPIHQGFDRQFATANAGHPKSYYPPYFKNSKVLADEKESYLTDVLTDAAVDFLEKHENDRPFMLSLYYYSVHGPLVGRKDYVKHFESKGLSGPLAQYAAMVKSVDDSVGRVRAALESRGLDQNTIVIFLSDQGGALDNAPLRGSKKSDTLYEGGARVPFLFYWPGVTQAGINKSLVQSTDLFPTLVEIAGGESADYKDVDGVSLLPTLRNNSVLERGAPIFGYRAYEDLYASVRDGDWKLLAHRNGDLKLYNLAQDVSEKNDVAQQHPEITDRLKSELVAWEQEMKVEKYSGIQGSDASVGSSQSADKIGNVLLHDDFNREEKNESKEDIGNGWSTNSKGRADGQKQVDLDNGALHVTMAKNARHRVSVRHELKYSDVLVEARIKLSKRAAFTFDFADLITKKAAAGHVCAVTIEPRELAIKDGITGRYNPEFRKKVKAAGGMNPTLLKSVEHKTKRFDVDTKVGIWHPVQIRMEDSKITVHIDGQLRGEFTSEGFAHPTKSHLRLGISGDVWLDDLKVTDLSGSPRGGDK